MGVAGQAVMENGAVRAWRHISSINFRVARSVMGCAGPVMPFIYETAGGGGARPRIFHTMIISPPGGGKTTLLRDMVRQISDGVPCVLGNGLGVPYQARNDAAPVPFSPDLTVGLVDERSEVAGCFRGIAQNDVGIRTDVLDGCPKAEGMVMLLRAMSPDVIAVDELGGKGDAQAVEAVLMAGVRLLCTAHGSSLEDINKNPALAGLVSRGVFRRYIVLSAPGCGALILDEDGGKLCSQP